MTNRILCIAALALMIGLQACNQTKNAAETKLKMQQKLQKTE